MTICWSRYRKTVVNDGSDAVNWMNESLSGYGALKKN